MSTIIVPPSSVYKTTTQAPKVWNALNGLVAIYKPQGIWTNVLLNQLKLHLCTDLNELDKRPPEPYVHIHGETNKELSVTVEPSYADHELVVGPRYQPSDIRMLPVNLLSGKMSGVTIIGINNGTAAAHRLRNIKPISYFKVKGILGKATDNNFVDGRIIEKANYHHIKRHHIDKICATLQSSYQKSMFEACGVDIQSQAAYELAVQGLIRPTQKEIPLIYNLKCIDFNPPEFTLEIVCLNTSELALKQLVQNLGLAVRTNATCSLLQCFQIGIFNIEHALLKRNWSVQPIIDNMYMIKKIMQERKELFMPEDPILKQFLADDGSEVDTDVEIYGNV
ncbi:mitochondrial mRNA pseudouridine synthase Trub2 [Chelonus insularis]|uniref:mitochondrial mRNA pseudouridine synthase Trub2 n=1 Tax=Chelonus insularis TaxID=460826 RepID=UPI00158D33F1|nr:mitochondrial mRNA pseudouridine synthase Trub2 [Chelonus insularis]